MNFLFVLLLVSSPLEDGREAIRSMAGCYLVDYTYVETEALQKGYERSSHMYDPNRRMSAKEWIYLEEISPKRLRLQHILFIVDKNGKLIKESLLKHQSQDWEYGATKVFDYTGRKEWKSRRLKRSNELWTRRLNDLDDGPRYQCSARWIKENGYPLWTCENYAPIPGRETRDMKRKDYHGLQRITQIIPYGSNWLERQTNIKTIEKEDGSKEPLAKERGKTWYTRLPDEDCLVAQAFVQSRQQFWTLAREVWDNLWMNEDSFKENRSPSKPRFEAIWELGENYTNKNISEDEIPEIKSKILKIIQDYKLN